MFRKTISSLAMTTTAPVSLRLFPSPTIARLYAPLSIHMPITLISMMTRKDRFLSTSTDEEMKVTWKEKIKNGYTTLQELENILDIVVLGRKAETLRDKYQVLKKAREIGLIQVDSEMKILNPDDSSLEESLKVVRGLPKAF